MLSVSVNAKDVRLVRRWLLRVGAAALPNFASAPCLICSERIMHVCCMLYASVDAFSHFLCIYLHMSLRFLKGPARLTPLASVTCQFCNLKTHQTLP